MAYQPQNEKYIHLSCFKVVFFFFALELLKLENVNIYLKFHADQNPTPYSFLQVLKEDLRCTN